MIPRGGHQLIAKRLENWGPKGDVWVNYGDFREPGSPHNGTPLAITDWAKWAETCQHPELLIRPEDPIERLDLRCIAGLGIVLFFAQWDAKVAKLYERLQDYAAEIVVESPCFDLDAGWFWVRNIGQIEMSERWILTEYRNAQADCTAAGCKGDKVAYEKAQARELRAIERASWLKS
jgi:hypothetical protein